MLGAHSFQKTPDVDTPEDEHPLETLFALFVTLRQDCWALEVEGSATFSVLINSSLDSGRVGRAPMSS
ncbi:hypothetical protein E5288_WYG003032 [Bos mutus]|uniref:Uncharacterized protein n=1 Tax=Bos mutus TaxID=72004 RepID=A0A6B0RC41_9CETA|nr:hypothetical protein [Bos mutus]